MSVIVWKNGIMASDSRAWGGNRQYIGIRKKVHRLNDGSLLGITSSTVGLPDHFKRLVEADLESINLESALDLEAILVKPSGRIFYWHEGTHFAAVEKTKFMTVGSGSPYALGALLHDKHATAEDAVRAAIKGDYCCGLPVRSMSLRQE